MTGKATITARRAPKSWLITAFLASLAIAYVAFVFGPAQASIGTLRSQLNERRQHILQANGLVLPVERAAEQLAKTRILSAQWKDAAPDPGEISGCFAKLTAEAKAAGVAIERFDPQLPTEMHVLAQHGVTVHFRGQFPEVFDFVRRIEELPGSVWLPTLHLTADGPTLRGELNLTIFVDRSDSVD